MRFTVSKKSDIVFLQNVEKGGDALSVCDAPEDSQFLSVFTDDELPKRRVFMVKLCGETLVSLTPEGISARIVEPVEAEVLLIQQAEGTPSVHYELRVYDKDTKRILLDHAVSVLRQYAPSA